MENFPKNISQKIEQEENNIEKPTIKEGVDFVFEQHPELAEIGTKEQYTDYINAFFPESKIKDIVWHGTDKENFESILKTGFKKENENLSIKNNVFFARFYNAYGNDAYGVDYKVLIPALVNARKIQIQQEGITISDVDSLYKKGYDALIQLGDEVNRYKNGTKLTHEEIDILQHQIKDKFYKTFSSKTGKTSEEIDELFSDEDKIPWEIFEQYINTHTVKDVPFTQLAVKNEQIHILGSNSDIQKFQDFVEREK